MTVLSFDTAAPVIGVGLRVGAAVLARHGRVGQGAEGCLLPWALALCAEAGVALRDVTGVAVARGPGAFTGLRVGLATACGLAQALGVPVAPVCSLRSRALAVGGDAPVLALLDARKGRAYAALYRGDELLRGPADVPPEQALAWVEGPFVATGEGALVWGALVEERGGRVAVAAADPPVGVIAALGARVLASGEGIPASRVRPVYLREADAAPPRRD